MSRCAGRHVWPPGQCVCVCRSVFLCWMSERAKDWQMKKLWLPHFVHAYEYDSFIAVYSFSCKPAARPWNCLGSLNYYYNLLLSCWIINAQFAHIVSVKTNRCIRIRIRICSGNRFYLVQDFFEVFNFEILTGFFGASGFIFLFWVRSKSRRCNSVLIDIRFIYIFYLFISYFLIANDKLVSR